MFEAKQHSLLVPFDGTFHARESATAPPKGKDKDDWKDGLEDEVEKLGAAQERLYADGRYAVLVVFQALDAAGKDGTIRHVFTGVNPVGLRVAAFKQPTPLELAHDFLWRTTAQLPERGHITIFNRSYYEEVLVVRVHPEYLAAQRLPDKPSAKLWAERLRAIADHERYLAEQGTVILKFWLNVSKAEQRKRFLERLERPDKNWKFSLTDAKERGCWKDYMRAYEDMIRHTATPEAPWFVVPADNKWFTRVVVAGAVIDALADLDLHYPKVGKAKKKDLAAARLALKAE